MRKVRNPEALESVFLGMKNQRDPKLTLKIPETITLEQAVQIVLEIDRETENLSQLAVSRNLERATPASPYPLQHQDPYRVRQLDSHQTENSHEIQVTIEEGDLKLPDFLDVPEGQLGEDNPTYELFLSKEEEEDLKSKLISRRYKSIKKGNQTASDVVRGFQGVVQIFTQNKYNISDFFDGVYTTVNNNIYQDTGRRYGVDSLIACRDEKNYMIARGRTGYMLIANSVKIHEKQFGGCFDKDFEKGEIQRVLDAIYVPGELGSGTYYFTSRKVLYYVSVNSRNEHADGKVKSFQPQIQIEHDDQWFGCLRYSQQLRSLFLLSPNSQSGLDILVIQINSSDHRPHSHDSFARIVDRRQKPEGFKWFDFVAGDSSRLFAVTPDHHCTIIRYIN